MKKFWLLLNFEIVKIEDKEGRIIKKLIINVLMLITALILQLAFPPDFIFQGVKPDFLLIVIVVIGLSRGVKEGVGFGFVAGMLQNIFQGGFSGIYTLVKILIGGLSGFIEKNIFKDKIILPPIVIFFMTIIHETIFILLSEKLLFNVKYLTVLKTIILPEALLNSVLGFFVYYIYFKLCYHRGNHYE